jgi:hypothetical protein
MSTMMYNTCLYNQVLKIHHQYFLTNYYVRWWKMNEKFTIKGVFFLISKTWHKWLRLHKDAMLTLHHIELLFWRHKHISLMGQRGSMYLYWTLLYSGVTEILSPPLFEYFVRWFSCTNKKMFWFIIFSKYVCEEQPMHQISVAKNAISNFHDFLIFCQHNWKQIIGDEFFLPVFFKM